MRKQKSLPFWITLFSLLFYFSCSKLDSEISTPKSPTSIERFFNLPTSADPRVKAIAQSIREQERDHPFLNNFTKRTGWPVWDKVKIIDQSKISSARGSSGGNSALVFIPFVQDSAITVNAVLAVRMNTADTSWRVLYASNYESFGFANTSDSTWNARDVFQFFAFFQHDIFGHTKFLIKDHRLFNTTIDTSFITLKKINGVAINSRTNRTADWFSVTECGMWQICGAPNPNDPAPARTASTNDNCWGIEICNTYYYDDGFNIIESIWSDNDGNEGNGTWANNTPCSNQPNCTAAWTPLTTYVTIDGVTYTPQSYPGMNAGYPWLWWEYQIENTEIDPNVTDNDSSMIWWDPSVSDPNTVYTQQARPNFWTMNSQYPKTSNGNDDMPSSAVCAMIGGEVLTKYNQGAANNACCLRVSRALLYSGINIPEISGQTWKGADGKNYFYYVEHLFNWLNKTFGAPDVHKTAADGAPRGTKFADHLTGLQNRGIYIMMPISRTAFRASGHASLWGGLNAIGSKNYFKDASDVYIWRLPQ